MIYPWQEKEWVQLNNIYQQKRLPHALLFSGVAGLGKQTFTEHFLQLLLCSSANKSACQTLPKKCHACHTLLNKTHPNVLWVQPEKAGQAIKIDQIRQVSEFIEQSSMQGDFHIAIIHPADSMNISAANALLKTLEEPPSGAMMILISDHPNQLPATILSRTQKVHFKAPSKAEALKWLSQEIPDPDAADALLTIANGAPLAALKLKETTSTVLRQTLFNGLFDLLQREADPLQLALQLQGKEFDLLACLDFCISWVMDVIRVQYQDQHVHNTDFKNQLLTLQHQKTPEALAQWMTDLVSVRKQICLGINFNKQLSGVPKLINSNPFFIFIFFIFFLLINLQQSAAFNT